MPRVFVFDCASHRANCCSCSVVNLTWQIDGEQRLLLALGAVTIVPVRLFLVVLTLLASYIPAKVRPFRLTHCSMYNITLATPSSLRAALLHVACRFFVLYVLEALHEVESCSCAVTYCRRYRLPAPSLHRLLFTASPMTSEVRCPLGGGSFALSSLLLCFIFLFPFSSGLPLLPLPLPLRLLPPRSRVHFERLQPLLCAD